MNEPFDEPMESRVHEMSSGSTRHSESLSGAVEDGVSVPQHESPRSGVPRSLYIVRNGNAGIWYQPHFHPATLGPGTLFGEGGFLFGRQHSASVIAEGPLECWVVELSTFRHHILPSDNMKQIFPDGFILDFAGPFSSVSEPATPAFHSCFVVSSLFLSFTKSATNTAKGNTMVAIHVYRS